MSRPFVDGFIDIIERPIFSIHIDLNTMILQHGKKFLLTKLATLITIENTRYSILQNRLFKGCDTKISIHRIRQLPRQYLPGIDVNDAHKVHRSPWRYPEVHIADESKAPDASALPLWYCPVQLFVLFLKTHSLLEAGHLLA